MNLILLVSGGLGYTCLKDVFQSRHQIAAIFTDKRSTDIIEFASQHSIPVLDANPRQGAGRSFLSSRGLQAEIILSINYLYIVDQDVIEYPTIAAINLHGSLLPKYRGRTPHVWAIINNERKTGVSAHLIKEECDAGPIIEQAEIEITPEDTGGSILTKFVLTYPIVVKEVLDKAESGILSAKEQDHQKATYFGKRTPSSGHISWSWQRERIMNWIRAQAFPYPGAFSYFKGEKITIDKIEFDETGFNFADPDGLILRGGPQPVVKTPNGAVRVVSIRENVKLLEGEKLE